MFYAVICSMTTEDLLQKATNLLAISVGKATPRNSMALSAVYTCVKVISETVGMLPLHHYQITDNGRAKLNNDLSYKVSVRPNEFTSASDFYAAWVASALLYGNGYVLITKTPYEINLNVLDSRFMDVKTKKGVVKYHYAKDDNANTYESSQILHLKGLGFDGLEGLSPVEYAAEAYGFALSAQKYGAEFFKNGAHLKGFIEMPAGVQLDGRTKEEKLGTLQRIKNAVLNGLKGESSAGGIGVLENGMKFSAMGLPNDQAQFLESRRFSREEVATMFRVPPYMVGEMGNAIKSNIEQQSIEFIQYAIAPWLVKMEQEMRYKLLSGIQDQFFKFNVNAYLRGTALDRAQYLKEMRYAGIITDAEARAYEDLPIQPTQGNLLISKNVWGADEYELELQKRRNELTGQQNEG